MQNTILNLLTKVKYNLHTLKARLSGNKYFSNTVWIISGKIFQMLLQLIVGMITVRYLGPSNYGIIEYTKSYVAFMTTFASLGLSNIAVKELLEQPDNQGQTLGTMITFRVCCGILSTAIITLLVYFIDEGDTLIMKVAFLQSLSLVFQSFDLINYWYQSNLESKVSIKIQTVAYIIMATYKIVILILQKNVTWFAFTTTLESIAVASFLFFSYHRRKAPKFSFSFQRGIGILKQSYQFVLSGIMVLIYNHMDRIMLKQMLNESVVGQYSAAMNISLMWTFILNALTSSAEPMIISAKKKDEALYIKQLKRVYAAIIWIGIFVAGGIFICSEWIIRLMYGNAYLPAVPILRISVWHAIFAMLGATRGIWIVCENKARYVKYILGIGAIVNLILNYLLIPVWGASGAAAATLITQFTTAVIAPLFFKGTRIHTKYVVEAFLLKGIR